MENKRIDIFFNVADNYAQHLAVTIASIISNIDDDAYIFFYVLTGGISKSNKSRIAKLKRKRPFEINYIYVDSSDFKGFPITNSCKRIPLEGYYRLIIGDKFPEIQKALYIDVDVIVNLDLLKAFNEIHLGDNLVGAVKDFLYLEEKEEYTKRLNTEGHFNAGVLFLNLKKWRELKIKNKCYEYVKHNYQKIKLQDQDVLNAVLDGYVKWLSPVYNVQAFYFVLSDLSKVDITEKDIEQIEGNDIIVHYTSSRKPWIPNVNHPKRKDYFYYLAMTPWKNYYLYYFRMKLFEILKILYYYPFPICLFNQKVRKKLMKYIRR